MLRSSSRRPHKAAESNSVDSVGLPATISPMPISRTLGPLHFEDLEPHRFEDLVRQLAYGFRTWSALEATGRLGNDEGVDIRGIEVGVARPLPGTEPDDIDLTEEEDPISFEREWRIQCKRYRTLRPGEMKKVVADLVPDVANPPHGVVVAAACDVSGRAIETFHTEAAQLGVREHFLWTNAHIEDMLFRPEYDHLLFAYFGVSLRVRRASRLQEVRSRIALKRKLTRAFSVSDLTESLHLREVIVRDLEYSGRLLRSDLRDYDSLDYPPWHKVWAVGFHPVGLAVQTGRFDGWLRGDGVWDILEATESLQAQSRRDPEAYTQYLEAVPEDERVSVARMALLPYRAILEVDPLGDFLLDEEHFGALPVHLFCDFGFGEHGPYVTYDDGEKFEWWQATSLRHAYPGSVELDPEKREALF